MHFAAHKAVGESCYDPLKYYSNNVNASTTLLEVMKECGCNRIVFSSSSTAYGDPEYLPVDENHPVGNRTRDSIQWEKWLEEAFADGDLSRDKLDFLGQFCSIEFLVRAAPMA